MSTPLTDALHEAHAQGFRDAARLIRDVAQRIADDHPEPEEAVTNITEGYRQALAPFIADMEAQAKAWADSRGIEISPSIRTSGGRRMEVWLVWDVEVGRATDDEWAWSAYYDAVAEAMP